MSSKLAKVAALSFVCILFIASAVAQSPQFLSFSEAQPILNTYLNTLPAELKPSGQPTAAAWDKWVRTQDKDIRSRLERGQEDTLTNLLRLGVTFTKEERISYTQLERYGKDKYVDSLASKRADDLIRALNSPHANEGMTEMRSFLEKQNFNLKTPDGQKRVKAYMLANLGRMRDEVIKAEAELYKNKNANLSQQFKDRGISTDSNLYPDYMIQVHLKHMMDQGLLKPGSIRRVAIVGPGLDFVNKNSGSDFYPPQTTQPFAVIDTLARLKLADPAAVELYTFDISSRVNRHVAKARSEAAAGKWYTIQLLSNPSDQWNKDYAAGFLDYWQKLGNEIGKPASKIPVPEAASDIWNRAISVRPAVVERVTPEDMNVVFQTLTLPADKQFDLVIGTNIFVYYASLEQSLARANIGSMVRPGGFLISNELLPSKAPSKLTDSLQTKVDVSTGDTEYMYTYARQK
ncbi:MAG TPA: hypothetical protein VK976_13045 [Verrucomicrobiae bacterium]|jgi:hypothetical protein|nr:hypothetical protein [Verrucomicrobiae bacterium]